MLHVRRGGTIPVNRWLVGAAATYVAAALVWVHSPLWGEITWFNLPVVIGGFDKTFLSLPRLLHILAVSYLIVALPAVSNLFRTQPGPSAGSTRQALAAGFPRRHGDRHGGAGDEADQSGRLCL